MNEHGERVELEINWSKLTMLRTHCVFVCETEQDVRSIFDEFYHANGGHRERPHNVLLCGDLIVTTPEYVINAPCRSVM